MKKIKVFFFLLFALSATQVSAGETLNRLALPFIGRFAPAETFLDNTERGTTALTIPGWINSDQASDIGFGVVFTTGASRYLIKNVTLMVASLPNEAEFTGDVKVEIYKAASAQDVPEGSPLFEKTLKSQTIKAKPDVITIPVNAFELEPSTRYGIVLKAPNQTAARVMGFQVPDVQPKSDTSFSVGLPFWGGTKGGWIRILNPYIWVEGWDLGSSSTTQWVNSCLGAIALLLVGLLAWVVVRSKSGN